MSELMSIREAARAPRHLGISRREFAKRNHCAEGTVRYAIRKGHLATLPDGTVDPEQRWDRGWDGKWASDRPVKRKLTEKVAEDHRPSIASLLPCTYVDFSGRPFIGFDELCRVTGIPASTLFAWHRKGFGPRWLNTGGDGSYTWVDCRHFIISDECGRAFENYFPERLLRLRLALLDEEVALVEQTMNKLGNLVNCTKGD